jgi:hypothetical protein
MSLITNNKNKKAYQIAKGTKLDVFLDPDEEANGDKIIKGNKIMPFFDMSKNDGIRCLLSGSTGSGKSYMCRKAIEQINPKKVYIFSSVDDGDYDNLPCEVMKVDLNQIISRTGMDIHQIYECMEDKCVAVFDDIMSFGNKMSKPYLELRLIMLQKSRHKKQSVFVCEQTAQAGNAKGSREVLLNCQYFYCFPRNNFRAFNNLAKIYLGLTEKQIEHMKTLGRYVMINKNYPSYYVSNNEVAMI